MQMAMRSIFLCKGIGMRRQKVAASDAYFLGCVDPFFVVTAKLCSYFMPIRAQASNAECLAHIEFDNRAGAAHRPTQPKRAKELGVFLVNRSVRAISYCS